MNHDLHDRTVKLFRAKKFNEALRCADEALLRDGNDGIAWLHKGNCLFRLKQIEEAMQCFQNAVFHSPLHGEAWYAKGFVELAFGKEAAANRSFKEFLSVAERKSTELIAEAKGYLADLAKKGYLPTPHTAASLVAEGFGHEKRRRLTEAVGCYETALELNPSYSLALRMKAGGLAKAGKHEQAVEAWQKYLKRVPRCAASWCELGKIFKKLGRTEEAKECRNTARALRPAAPARKRRKDARHTRR